MQATADASTFHAEKNVRLSEPEPGQYDDDERSDADSVIDEEGTASDPIMETILAVFYSSGIDSPNDPIDKDTILEIMKEIGPDNLGLGGQAIARVLINVKWTAANDTARYSKTWRGLYWHIAAALGDESEYAYMAYYYGREDLDDELTPALVNKARDAFETKGFKFTRI